MADIFKNNFKEITVGGNEGEVLKRTAKLKSLLNELKKLDDDYSATVQDKANIAVGVKEFDSDEELRKQAEKSLENLYGAKYENETSKAAHKLAKLSMQEDSAKNDLASAQEKAQKAYESKLQSMKEKYAKQGLMHSSVKTETEKAYKTDLDATNEELETKHDATLAKINEDINYVKEQRDIALGNYDIKKAAELDKKYGQLIKQRDDAKQQYDEKRNEEMQKLVQEIKEGDAAYENLFGDYDGDKKENYQKRYELADAYFASLSKSDAKNDLKNNSSVLKSLLGLYYGKLADKYGG